MEASRPAKRVCSDYKKCYIKTLTWFKRTVEDLRGKNLEWHWIPVHETVHRIQLRKLEEEMEAEKVKAEEMGLCDSCREREW